MEYTLLKPKSKNCFLFSVVLSIFLIAIPAFTAEKDPSTSPDTEQPQQDTTPISESENPFNKQPKKDPNPKNIWILPKPETKPDDPPITEDEDLEIPARRQVLIPYLETLRRWRYGPELGDLSELYDWRPRKKKEKHEALTYRWTQTYRLQAFNPSLLKSTKHTTLVKVI